MMSNIQILGLGECCACLASDATKVIRVDYIVWIILQQSMGINLIVFLEISFNIEIKCL